jgi:acetoin utilization deacetylase AcuC-like enzyme
MQRVLLLRDHRFSQHLENIPHLESPKRFRAFEEMLGDPSLEGRMRQVEPRMASAEELSWVHTPEHIERVAGSAGKLLTSFDMDTQASERSYDVARLAVGGLFSLMDEVWAGRGTRSFACVRPPGHHAEPGKAMGFCLFNNVALAARYLMERYSVGRIMILDVDLHHGNGTQAAFYDTDRVLFVSTHLFPGYPGTGHYREVGQGEGEGYTVNIPLPKGIGDRDYARILYFFVNPLAQAYRPDIILVSCGFDLYYRDRLGCMAVTAEGYAMIAFLLTHIAEKVCKGRIAFIMEGGYSLRGIRECGLSVMQVLCGLPLLKTKQIDRVIGNIEGFQSISSLRKVAEVHTRYWSFMRQPVSS